MVNQFFIVNKAGGMIYKYTKNSDMEINSLIILTSTLHSLNELSINIFEISEFCQIIEMRESTIYLYKTLTNIMFIFTVTKNTKEKTVFDMFKEIYKHFCDYVLCNPFYQMEMPINCSKFRPENYFI